MDPQVLPDMGRTEGEFEKTLGAEERLAPEFLDDNQIVGRQV